MPLGVILKLLSPGDRLLKKFNWYLFSPSRSIKCNLKNNYIMMVKGKTLQFTNALYDLDQLPCLAICVILKEEMAISATSTYSVVKI